MRANFQAQLPSGHLGVKGDGLGEEGEFRVYHFEAGRTNFLRVCQNCLECQTIRLQVVIYVCRRFPTHVFWGIDRDVISAYMPELHRGWKTLLFEVRGGSPGVAVLVRSTAPRAFEVTWRMREDVRIAVPAQKTGLRKHVGFCIFTGSGKRDTRSHLSSL